MKIAIVIPSYRVSRHILDVLAQIGPDAWRIFVVDDACPEQSGKLVESQCRDERVQVIYNAVNLGLDNTGVAPLPPQLARRAQH